MIPGDSVVFMNLLAASPDWEHENTLYVGNNEYFAQLPGGAGIFSGNELPDILKKVSGSTEGKYKPIGVFTSPLVP